MRFSASHPDPIPLPGTKHPFRVPASSSPSHIWRFIAASCFVPDAEHTSRFAACSVQCSVQRNDSSRYSAPLRRLAPAPCPSSPPRSSAFFLCIRWPPRITQRSPTMSSTSSTNLIFSPLLVIQLSSLAPPSLPSPASTINAHHKRIT